MIFFYKLLCKNMNSTYEFTLKEEPKVKMEIFWGTKSWRNFIEGLKQKVDIFIGIKNIFNPIIIFKKIVLSFTYNIYRYHSCIYIK